MSEEYKILIKDLRLLSTNDMYVPTSGRGGRGAFLRTSSELAEFQERFAEKFSELELSLDQSKCYSFDIRVSMPEFEYYINSRKRLRARDSSNYIKALEDCLTSKLGYNDRNNIRVSLEKGYNSSNLWYVEVVIRVFDIENKLEFIEEDYDYVIQ